MSTKSRGKSAAAKKIAKQKAPASNVSNMFEIENYFKEHILDQDTSIRRLSVTICSLLRSIRTPTEKKEPLLFMLTLAGPSGTGKTATVQCLKHFLGMNEGFEYENQYIEFHTTASIATNDEYGIQCDILERLNNAVTEHGQVPPPYIILFIDDYEHASYAFKLLLNTLLTNGQYIIPGDNQFICPKQTALLIICKCHYGGEDIIDMVEDGRPRCDDWAKHHITREMEKAGYTVQRRNQILPYYPLTVDMMTQVLHQKLNTIISDSRFLGRFGIEVIASTPSMREMLVKHVLRRLDKRCGVHGGERMLKDKLDLLLETGIAAIDQMREKEHASIVLDSSEFDMSLFGEIFDKKLHQVTGGDLIRAIKENPENKQYLAKCDPSMKGSVETVSMCYGEKPVCGLIMNVNYLTIINNYDVDETNKLLQDKNKKLKACLRGIKNVLEEKDKVHTVEDIIKKNRELLHESSDDSDDSLRLKALEQGDQPLVLHKRKNEIQEQAIVHHKKAKIEELSENESMQMDEESETFSFSFDEDLTFSDVFDSDEDWNLEPPPPKRRGRPLKLIEGFVRIESGSKDMLFECVKCHARISKMRYTKNHHC